MSNANHNLGISRRIAALFLSNQLTPLIALSKNQRCRQR
jgi:hypothetical protein